MAAWWEVARREWPFLVQSFNHIMRLWTTHPENINPHVRACHLLYVRSPLQAEGNRHEHDGNCNGDDDDDLTPTEPSAPTPADFANLTSMLGELGVCWANATVVHRRLVAKKSEWDADLDEWALLWANGKVLFVPSPAGRLDAVPHYYPNVRAYCMEVDSAEDREPQLVFSALRSASATQQDTQRVEQVCERLLNKLTSWAKANENGYRKQVQCDQQVEFEAYASTYSDMKRKYGYLVDEWEECTDPIKYVYEDIAIASYLLALWAAERRRLGSQKKQRFVDIGCGNGLLTFLLTSEGHPGCGVDLKRRRVWAKFAPQCTLVEADLLKTSLANSVPAASQAAFNLEWLDAPAQDVDWVVSNHADELTPYTPLLASALSPTTRFFALPCCMFTFQGRRFSAQGGATQGRYWAYLDHVRAIGDQCGFRVCWDRLRIPSVKCVALVGTERTGPPAFSGGGAPRPTPRSHLAERDRDARRGRTQQQAQAQDSLALDAVACMLVAHVLGRRHMSKKARLGEGQSSAGACAQGEGEDGAADVVWCGVRVKLPSSGALDEHGTVAVGAGDCVEMTLPDLAQALRQREPQRKGQAGPRQGGGVLRQLPGGIKTFLAMYHQVFEVVERQKGRPALVRLRDWSKSPNADELGEEGSSRLRTKPCFFHTHGSCPKSADACPFSHAAQSE